MKYLLPLVLFASTAYANEEAELAKLVNEISCVMQFQAKSERKRNELLKPACGIKPSKQCLAKFYSRMCEGRRK